MLIGKYNTIRNKAVELVGFGFSASEIVTKLTARFKPNRFYRVGDEIFVRHPKGDLYVVRTGSAL